MSTNTQKQGRSFYTERDYYAFTPSARAAGNVVLENREWEAGLVAATRVGDPTFDIEAKSKILNPAPEGGGD